MLPETLSAFRRAGLAIKVLKGPIEPRARGVFQLDIRRSPAGEYFRIWPGPCDARFDALDVRADLRQLVLRVCEPRRRFERVEQMNRWVLERCRKEGHRILRVTSRQFVVEH